MNLINGDNQQSLYVTL